MRALDDKAILILPADSLHAGSIASMARQLLKYEKSLDETMGELTPWAGDRREILKQMRRPNFKFFVADYNGEIVGYVKIIVIGIVFSLSQTGLLRWILGIIDQTARHVFNMILRRPRPNVEHTGAYIAGIFVEPKYRRSKVGRMLVKSAEEWLQELGIKSCDLHVMFANEGARRFWESLGYEPAAMAMRKKMELSDEAKYFGN